MCRSIDMCVFELCVYWFWCYEWIPISFIFLLPNCKFKECRYTQILHFTVKIEVSVKYFDRYIHNKYHLHHTNWLQQTIVALTVHLYLHVWFWKKITSLVISLLFKLCFIQLIVYQINWVPYTDFLSQYYKHSHSVQWHV